MRLAQPNSGQEAGVGTSMVPPSVLSKSLPEAELGLVPSQRLEVVCYDLLHPSPFLSSFLLPSLPLPTDVFLRLPS